MSQLVVQALLVGAIALILILPIGIRIARKRFDVFEPIIIFAAAYGAMFVVRPAAMILSDERFFFGPLRATDVSDTFTEMLVLAATGALGFMVGYELRLGRKYFDSDRPRRSFDNSVAVAGALIVTLLCATPFTVFLATEGGTDVLWLIARGRSAELSDTLNSLSTYPWQLLLMLVPCALTLLAIGAKTRSMKVLALGALVTVVLLFRALPVGDRLMLLPFVGGLFVLYYLGRSTRPRLLVIVAVAVVALVGAALIRDARDRQSRGESVGQSFIKVASHPDEIIDPMLRGPETDMAPALAVALKHIPEDLPYAYGRTVAGDLFARPIPRVVWEGKPLPPRQRLVARAWPREYREGSINSEFSVLLYFFWDFGWIGALVGLAAYGVLARLLYEALLYRPESIAVQVTYALSLWLLVIALRESPVDAVIHFAFLVLPAILVFALAARKGGRSAVVLPSTALSESILETARQQSEKQMGTVQARDCGRQKQG
jgi:hypothetical protein